MEDFHLTRNIQKLILKDSLVELQRAVTAASYMDSLGSELNSIEKEIKDKADLFMKTIRESLDSRQKAYKNLKAQSELNKELGRENPQLGEYGKRMLDIRDNLEKAVDNISKTLSADPRLRKADIMELIRVLGPKNYQTNSQASSHKTVCNLIELL